MKIYRNETVFDAALKRIEYLFREFDEVIPSISGGKDSTVVLELCLMVARKLNRLPLKVLWIDQEVEWQGTVDYMAEVMTRPEVHPIWLQVPMVITNNASIYHRYSHCWDPAKQSEWTHPQHPVSIKENRYGTERFHAMFNAVLKTDFAGRKACIIGGVRTEEAPKRYLSLTAKSTYKWVTWGKVVDKPNHFIFYPIYDWDWRDVWKSIHDNRWAYNRIYDEMYRLGVPVQKMRISNLHHETSVSSLLIVQEIEPATWQKIAARVPGANSIKHLKAESFLCPDEYPSMFSSWAQYAYHIIDNLVPEKSNRERIRSEFDQLLVQYMHPKINRSLCRSVINTVLRADWDMTVLRNWELRPEVSVYRNWRKGRFKWDMLDYREFLPEVAIADITRKVKMQRDANNGHRDPKTGDD